MKLIDKYIQDLSKALQSSKDPFISRVLTTQLRIMVEVKDKGLDKLFVYRKEE